MQSGSATRFALADLQELVGSSTPIRFALDVSSGPWWGFNGVQTLVLGDAALFRVQGRLAIRPRVVLNVFPLSRITDARWVPTRSGRSGRLSMAVRGKRVSFVARSGKGAALAELLGGK